MNNQGFWNVKSMLNANPNRPLKNSMKGPKRWDVPKGKFKELFLIQLKRLIEQNKIRYKEMLIGMLNNIIVESLIYIIYIYFIFNNFKIDWYHLKLFYYIIIILWLVFIKKRK